MRVRRRLPRRARRAGRRGPGTGGHLGRHRHRRRRDLQHGHARRARACARRSPRPRRRRRIRRHDQRAGGHDQHQQRPGDPVGHHGHRRQRAHDDHRRRAKYRGFRITLDRQRHDQPPDDPQRRRGPGRLPDGGGILNLSGVVPLDLRARDQPAAAPRPRRRDRERPGHADDASHGLIDNNTAGDRRRRSSNLGGVETPDRGAARRGRDDDLQNTAGTRRHGGIELARRPVQHRSAQPRDARRQRRRRPAASAGWRSTPARRRRSGDLIARNTVGRAIVNCAGTKPTEQRRQRRGRQGLRASGGGGSTPVSATACATRAASSTCSPLAAASPAVDRVPLAQLPGGPRATHAACSRPQGPRATPAPTSSTRPPTVTITDGPTGTITHGDVEFRFQATEPGVTVQCRLTGPGQSGGFAECYKSNAQPYSGLADGAYTFSVRAVDAAFPNPPVTTRTFTVDTARRTRRSPAGRPGRSDDTTPTFTFTARARRARRSSAARRRGVRRAARRRSHRRSSHGAHTFEVRATDAAGAPDATPASRTFTVDTVAPDTTITGGPTGTVASTSATFTFTSTETGSTFQCSLDGGGVRRLPGELHRPRAGRAHVPGPRDRRRRQHRRSPASRTWTVDTVAPETTITAGPTGPGRTARPPTFTFTSTEAGSTFQCRVDAGAFAACTSPHTTAVAGRGAHTFEVRAADSGGHTDQSAGVAFVRHDRHRSRPPRRSSRPPASNALLIVQHDRVQGTAEIGATVELRGGRDARRERGRVGDGQLDDRGGRRARRHAHLRGARDRRRHQHEYGRPTAPSPSTPACRTRRSPAARPARRNDDTPTFTFSSEAGATFECSIDGVAHTACPNPFTTPTLTQGAHTLSVRAVDLAGNRDNTPAIRNFIVDTVAPDTTINTGPTGPTTNTAPRFTFSATEAGATFECRLDTPSGNGTFRGLLVAARPQHDRAGRIQVPRARRGTPPGTPTRRPRRAASRSIRRRPTPRSTAGPNDPTNRRIVGAMVLAGPPRGQSRSCRYAS